MDERVDGQVASGPRRLLRLDGLVLLAGALALFATTHEPWWLVPLVIFLPDVFMLGYLAGTRVGAIAYNLGHTYLAPAVLEGVGLRRNSEILVALGLLWFAHIGMDRAAGYGLKYDDAFGHTHLGFIGKPKGAPGT